jgi:hypothetical protein
MGGRVKVSGRADLGGGFSPWRAGLMLPTQFSATIDDPSLEAVVEIEAVVRDGEPVCTAVRIEAREGGHVTARSIRRVPLARLVESAGAVLARRVEHDDNGAIRLVGGGETVRFDRRRRGPQGYDDAHYRHVADVYLAAARFPTKAVQEHETLGPVSHSTAVRWVNEAKRRFPELFNERES